MFGMCKAPLSVKKRKSSLVKHTSECGATVVEVAVIVPMIWIVLMGSIFLLFFFFDMGVLKSETMRTANETAREWRMDDHKSISEEKGIFEKRLKKRLILTKLDSESISVSLGTVTAKAKVSFYLAGKGLSFNSCSRAAVDNREKWIRIAFQGSE